MMRKHALGHVVAHASASDCTMLAFVLKRSSRVMPGFRGTPAGMTTTSMPSRASAALPMPTVERTVAGVEQWLRSAASPGVFTTSYSDSSFTSGDCLISSDMGCLRSEACEDPQRGARAQLSAIPGDEISTGAGDAPDAARGAEHGHVGRVARVRADGALREA